MFYNLFGCLHACMLHVLSVRLTRVNHNLPGIFIAGKVCFRCAMSNEGLIDCGLQSIGPH